MEISHLKSNCKCICSGYFHSVSAQLPSCYLGRGAPFYNGEVISSLVAVATVLPHLIQLCVIIHFSFPINKTCSLNQVTSRVGSRNICTHGGSHAALPSSRFSEEVSRLVATQGDPQQTACMMTGDFLWITGPRTRN